MTCTISLGPDNDLELRIPSGRAISVPVGPHSTQLLWRILYSATGERAAASGARFPSQAVVNAWAEEIMPGRRAEEEAERRAEREEAAKQRLA